MLYIVCVWEKEGGVVWRTFFSIDFVLASVLLNLNTCAIFSLLIQFFTSTFNAWYPVKGTNLQLKPKSLFKYVRPFNGHQTLKCDNYEVPDLAGMVL